MWLQDCARPLSIEADADGCYPLDGKILCMKCHTQRAKQAMQWLAETPVTQVTLWMNQIESTGLIQLPVLPFCNRAPCTCARGWESVKECPVKRISACLKKSGECQRLNQCGGNVLHWDRFTPSWFLHRLSPELSPNSLSCARVLVHGCSMFTNTLLAYLQKKLLDWTTKKASDQA